VNVKIEMCMGSSCFARGNSKILSSLEEYVNENKRVDSVNIIGHLCMNNCSGGPVVRINGDDFLNKNYNEILATVKTILETAP